MKKAIMLLLSLAISLMAAKLNINSNSGSPVVIEFSQIHKMEIITDNTSTALIKIDGGIFTMGQEGLTSAMPLHQVTLSPFYIGRHEVSQQEWTAIMTTNPSGFSGNLDHPVEKVRFYDVLVFCNLKSMAENLTPCYTINNSTNPVDWGTVPATTDAFWNAVVCNWNTNGYRLPTEAEWEFAARGGNKSMDYLYSGSNNLGSVAWYSDNSGNITHKKGTKNANELGLMDMSGNVIEWVWDRYAPTYSAAEQTNPTGAQTGPYRVGRGGGYNVLANGCSYGWRNWLRPDFKNNYLGFRLARKF